MRYYIKESERGGGEADGATVSTGRIHRVTMAHAQEDHSPRLEVSISDDWLEV